MKGTFSTESLMSLLESKREINASEIKALMPGVPEQTVFSRIRALERKGLIYKCGKGMYSLGAKPLYKAPFFPKMFELNRLLLPEFVETSLCISSSDGSNIIIETDRKHVPQVLDFLRRRYSSVYSVRESALQKEALKDAIIVKALVSDAPLVVTDGIPVPSLEKILVDLVADRAFFRMSDDALHKEYQRAFEVYPINKNRLLRYAGRRGVTEDVEEQIAGVDLERVVTISIIQQTLKKQPVLRAWLFGSWSRQEERFDSDIDLLVDFDRNEKEISLLDHARYMLDIEDATGKKVDYVENGCLLPFAEKTANNDKYLIYERSA